MKVRKGVMDGPPAPPLSPAPAVEPRVATRPPCSALLFPSEVAVGLAPVQLRFTSPLDFPFPWGSETGLSAPLALSG